MALRNLSLDCSDSSWRYGMSGGAVNWSFRVRKGQCLVHAFSNLIVRAFYGPIEARHQLSMQQSRTCSRARSILVRLPSLGRLAHARELRHWRTRAM